MENYISLINEWCQKNKHPFPTYNFIGNIYNWKCCLKLGDFNPVISAQHSIKKDAKIEAAYIFYKNNINASNEKTTELFLKEATIFIIDGDQRSDCWGFFAAESSVWKSDFEVIVFANSMAKILKSSQPIEIKISKSQSKDSVDLDILISVGIILGKNLKKKLVIVSSDHILSQAAKDYNLDWVPNLPKLKEYFNL